MKLKYSRIRIPSEVAVSGIAVGTWLLAALSASAIPRVGEATVTELKGKSIFTRSGVTAPITAGMTLQVGDTIATGFGGTVGLDLKQNGNLLRIQPNSELTLTKLDILSDTDADTELFLGKGKVGGNAKKITQASKFEIKTPTCVAGIRGTEYSISSDGTVTVLSGKVEVIFVYPNGARSAPVTVRAHESVTPPPAPTPGAPPPTPTPQAATPAQIADAEAGNPITVTGQAAKPPVIVPVPPPTPIIPTNIVVTP